MNKIIAIAQNEVGYSEKNNDNRTKYGEWFGLNGVAWCGIFVSWCYAQAGTIIPFGGYTKGFAGCQTLFKVASEKGWLIKKEEAVAGDIVLFDWNGDGRYDHTGLFLERVNNEYFKTIEGNTSFKNDSNGGRVMERDRKYTQAIFIRLK